MKNKLNLPKKYEIKDTTPKKFHKYKNLPKLSYSQISSWNSTQYKTQYILGYIFNIKDNGNGFSKFGTQVGTALEYGLDIKKANGEDRKVLEEAFEHFNELDLKTLEKVNRLSNKNSEFEREIVLDMGEFCLQGFLDRTDRREDNKLDIYDYKTLSIKSKANFYKSEEYQQTRFYAKSLEMEGEEIGYVGVIGLDRTYAGTYEDPILHLSGEVIEIETPYDRSNIEKFLDKAEKTAIEISSLKDTYDKLSTLTFTL